MRSTRLQDQAIQLLQAEGRNEMGSVSFSQAERYVRVI
jgi:hypothetical protein